MIRKIQTLYKTNFNHEDIEHILKECPINNLLFKNKDCIGKDVSVDCNYSIRINDLYYCKSVAVFNPDKSKELSDYLFGGKNEKV